MFYPLKITDVTLRDGQEDFVLKYLRVDELAKLAGLLDRAGFYSLDCWGGTTFFDALTELREDPWERLRRLRRALSHTPLQIIVRGRMLVGFKPFQPEVVHRFIQRAAHLGVDIIRIYDNLNDVENMAGVITAAKELRKQVEATVLISQSPHVSIDDYLSIAGQLSNLGADVICINDSFGVMTPHRVAQLVTAYRRYFPQPLRLHVHDNLQAAVPCCQEGVRRGVELVDTTLGALSWPYGPPPLQSLMFSLGGTTHDPHLDMDVMGEASEYVEHLKEHYGYREPPVRKQDELLGPASIPGPLKDFLREELNRRDARELKQAAVKEAQQVWCDLGYPALKGRILEIVGLQTVENLTHGRRYDRLIPAMLDLLRGRFGRLHSPVKEELQQRALAGSEGVWETAATEGQLLTLSGLEQEEDILTFTLFPEEAQAFFTYRAASALAPAVLPQPAAPRPHPISILTQNLIMTYKGEEVQAELLGVGSNRKGKQVLYINIHDATEEIVVEVVPGPDGHPEYRITFHGNTYRLRLAKTFPRDQAYTPIFLEINGRVEEFLVKNA
jgi:pyruvate carboxylase subunit B